MVYEEIINGSTIDKLVYNYGDSGLVGFTLNGTEYFYVRNAQSDIIGILDPNGTQVVSYTYDTWGKLISITGDKALGEKNPYRYRGYRYDTETGYYYLQSRYYNPEIGRFLNADVLGGNVGALLSHNIFAYCNNNPVNGKDPNGFRPIYTQGEETSAMRRASYAAMNKFYANKSSSISNGNSGFNYFVSGIKAVGAGVVDKIGSRAGKIINTGYRKVCEVKALGPAFRISVAGESFAKSLGKEALGYVGDIGMGAYSAFNSFSKGQIAGGLIDLGATAVGIGIGVGIGAITGLLITASTPFWAVAGITVAAFAVSTAATVYIDKRATEIKDNHYGR
ncbi:RHS repeat-associated core domain-containing protein [uncultured Clostridium sp.]|uniref:RHS repeat-associated core domain-containing protein n=1 Tax=uncultured Clostridium sp. TaxID=59620 RepID=UPI003217738A